MASACVNNSPSPDRGFGWLSPHSSFTRDSDPNPIVATPLVDPDFIDFEFRLHDPVAVLHADELFSGGRLVPLHFSKSAPSAPEAPAPPTRLSRREELIGCGSASDIFAVSPKAPTCTSRWRELLRIKKQQQTANPKPDPGSRNPNPNPRSSALKQFLHRRSSLADPNLSRPLLKDSEPEAALSRLSLSSSTSSDENLRFSIDSDPNPNPNPNPHRMLFNRNPPRSRATSSKRTGRSPARRSADAATGPPLRCSSVDSPRMNASGKVVFQGLGRSASSPSAFKYKGGTDRSSYSANVRVINVPVPSKAGLVFGFLGSKNAASSGAGASRGRNHA
ncbi:hypothetical protein M6B38_220605 [Iris pallida]|uniref:Uncharacterized protein n=1 Tax=Iris pallida TaxID=29817 RepID=A0AAX6DYN1_IRIPA|nr:hypothetical protein M6B38_220605 [Iris pallida]